MKGKIGDEFESIHYPGLKLLVVDKGIIKCTSNTNPGVGWKVGVQRRDDCIFPSENWKLLPKKSENYQSFYERVK